MTGGRDEEAPSSCSAMLTQPASEQFGSLESWVRCMHAVQDGEIGDPAFDVITVPGPKETAERKAVAGCAERKAEAGCAEFALSRSSCCGF